MILNEKYNKYSGIITKINKNIRKGIEVKKQTLLFLLFMSLSAGAGVHEKANPFESDIIKIAIVASDFQATMDFYTQMIGMTKVREFDIDSLTSVTFGLSGGVPFHVTCLKLNDSPQATELKITSFPVQPEFQKSAVIQDGIGVQYLTIYVNEMKPFVERIRAKGVRFLGKTPAPAGEGKVFVLIQDPNGVFIELIGNE
jgi:catechol 2,3-dioxygenase-like lactoylglutathione lyase family enzyme